MVAGPWLQLRAEPEQVVLHGRISIDVYALPGEDHPEARPLARPPVGVLTAEVLVDDRSAASVLSNQPVPRRRVDQECLVAPGLDAVEWPDPGILPQGRARPGELRQ